MKKMAALLIFTIFLVLGSVGCQSRQTSPPSQSSSTVVSPPSLTFFPVAQDKYAGQAYPAALTMGTLVLENGYLRLGSNTTIGAGRLIVWPPGFSLRKENRVVQVLFPDGTLAASVGDSLDLAGGDVPLEIVEKYIGKALPENAKGPYWLTGNVTNNKSNSVFPNPSATLPLPSALPTYESRQIGQNWYFEQGSIYSDIAVRIESVFAADSFQQTLYTHNLSTGEDKKVLDLPNSRRVDNQPSIYGDKIVWSSVDATEYFKSMASSAWPTSINWDVFLLDLKTNQITQLTTEPHGQKAPRIFGDTVVWLDERNQDPGIYPAFDDIYAYDLKTQTEKSLTQAPTVEGYTDGLSIDGNMVVWSDSRNADPDVTNHPVNTGLYNNEIYVYDLSTNQERRITSSPLNDQYPQISGDTVVWLRQQDYRKADVFSFNLITGIETQISQSHYAAFAPTIYGNRIAWVDAGVSQGRTSGDLIEVDADGTRHYAGTEIYLYDIVSGKDTRLTSAYPEDNNGYWTVWGDPILSGNRLLCTSQGSALSRNYLIDLPSAYFEGMPVAQYVPGTPSPQLIREPPEINFFTPPGINPPAEELQISAISGPLDWELATDSGWLTLSSISGTATTEKQRIAVSAGAAGLPAGTHNGTITLRQKGTDWFQEIPVRLFITSAKTGTALDTAVEAADGTAFKEGIQLGQTTVTTGTMAVGASSSWGGGYSGAGDLCLVVRGKLINTTPEKLTIDFLADGFDGTGKQVSWCLSSGMLTGIAQKDLPANSAADFQLVLTWAENVNLIQIIANIHHW